MPQYQHANPRGWDVEDMVTEVMLLPMSLPTPAHIRTLQTQIRRGIRALDTLSLLVQSTTHILLIPDQGDQSGVLVRRFVSCRLQEAFDVLYKYVSNGSMLEDLLSEVRHPKLVCVGVMGTFDSLALEISFGRSEVADVGVTVVVAMVKALKSTS
jgi:hypothetical protein